MDAAVKGMRVALERIGEIVLRLKRFVNLDESERQLVDLNNALDQAVAAAAPLLADVTIERDFGALPEIECWPREVKQAVHALIENAAHATGPEGRITLRSWTREDELVLEVCDDGSGMSPGATATLFDFRFSAQQGRIKLGLGLASAWHVMRQHDGHIEVDSVEGEGSTFRLVFPRR